MELRAMTSLAHSTRYEIDLECASPQSHIYCNLCCSANAQLTSPGGRLLANAGSIAPDQSLTFNDPNFGPFVLIHLDNGQFVAYSSICTHAGCQVQFDPSSKYLVYPCHGAVYNSYNNAQVVAGPAPYPLQKLSAQYDPSSGNIYLNG